MLAYVAALRGEGTGFSSEIETAANLFNDRTACSVARELASHLRLKLGKTRTGAEWIRGGAGPGFSSEGRK